MEEKIKLHLGCGKVNLGGFINIDLLPNEGVDVVEDIRTLKSFTEESVDLIYACHVLEHISRHEYKKVLKRWYSLLRPNGVLRLSGRPNLREWFKYYFETGDFKTLLSALYGGQENKYNYHYMGWVEETLREDLLEAGFTNIKKYDWQTTEHSNIKDWSRDYLPYCDEEGNMLLDEEWFKGRFVNLNVEAIK
jgi:predicted SAM-dependent methyltransferase